MSPTLRPSAGRRGTRGVLSTCRQLLWFALLCVVGILGGQRAAPPAVAQESPTVRLRDVTRQSGVAFQHTIGDDKMSNIVESTGVGCALLDYDQDGLLDIYLISGVHLESLNDRPVLLRNDTPRQGRHWLMLELEGRAGRSNRDAIGSVVRCKIPGPDGQTRVLLRQKSSSGSYMSAHDPRLHFGLGTVAVVPETEIRSPDGAVQTLRNVKADQLLRVKQPSGVRCQVSGVSGRAMSKAAGLLDHECRE